MTGTAISSIGARVAVGLAALALLVVSACGPRDRGAEWEQTIRATGRITDIDHEARRVTIRSGLGKTTLRVSENARGFQNRQVGDKIYFVYYEAILVMRVPRDEPDPPVLSKYRLSPATEERPAVAMARARKFTAEFLSYDYQSKIAEFRGPDGKIYYIVAPMRLQNFLRTLVPGDRVSASIEEALAVSLEPLDMARLNRK